METRCFSHGRVTRKIGPSWGNTAWLAFAASVLCTQSRLSLSVLLLAGAVGTPAAGQTDRPLPLALNTEVRYFWNQTSRPSFCLLCLASATVHQTDLRKRKVHLSDSSPLQVMTGPEGDEAHVPETAHKKEGIKPTLKEPWVGQCCRQAGLLAPWQDPGPSAATFALPVEPQDTLAKESRLAS